MKPEITAEEGVTLRHKLLYARWLYEKGVGEAEHHDELSHMVAIMHFHNAVEMVLGNVLVYYGWASSAQLHSFRFAHMVEKIDQSGALMTPKVSLPERHEIVRLSEIRNGIMHHGQRFHREEVEMARAVCRRFLADAVRDFFEEDIETMSMGDLVENQYIRGLLQRASDMARGGEPEKAVALAALIVRFAERAIAYGLQRQHSASKSKMRFSSIEIGGLDLSGVVDGVFDRIGDVETRSLLLHLGPDVRAARRFFSYEVNVELTATSGVRQFRCFFAKPRDIRLSADDAEFAIHFATDVALKVQALGEGPRMGRRFSRTRRSRATGGWEPIEVDVPDDIDELEDARGESDPTEDTLEDA